jgi:hypothetical protein
MMGIVLSVIFGFVLSQSTTEIKFFILRTSVEKQRPPILIARALKSQILLY